MMRLLTCLLVAASCISVRSSAQFAPQVPLPGNEGIIASSPLFKEWVSGCTLYRGWLDIADKSLGQPTMGNPSDIYGPPDADVLSLGDSGVAVVTFPHTIFNGSGPDFAVFENAFADPLNDTMAYLELAFVEVSSDGIHFFRFPASCLMQDTVQLDNFAYSDARFYDNLAGKYLTGYGTPFDLDELKGTPGLDVNQVSHIRIVDVVGSIDPQYASKDKDGRIINAPYPSNFASGGFDLRGVGVISSNMPPAGIDQLAAQAALQLYPNPATDELVIRSNGKENLNYQVTDISGRNLLSGSFRNNIRINISRLLPGMYFVRLDNGREQSVSKIRKQ
jgi:hypothetical protein